MPGLKQSLLGMGNPLLDVIATVDQAFLDKYKVKFVRRDKQAINMQTLPPQGLTCGGLQIKMNDQILAEDGHQPMYEVTGRHQATPGCRAAQSLYPS